MTPPDTPAHPPSASAACLRFLASMNLDYQRWKEGESYDLAALADCWPAERDFITARIASRRNPDWRDIEALIAIGTPAAREAVRDAAMSARGAGASAALVHIVESDGWSPALEARLIGLLETMEGMDGSSDRVFDLCTAHPTPAIREQLLRNARIHSDPTVRYSSAAFLLHLAGHTPSRYVFEPPFRPRLLELNSDDYATYSAAVAWLRDMLAQPPS